MDEEWRLNALRAMVDPTIDRQGDLFQSQKDLVSLRDIFTMDEPSTKEQFVESYIMLHDGIDKQVEFSSI